MSAIKVGDLVMTVHSHCPHPSLGVPFKVEKLGFNEGRCAVCHVSIGVCLYAVGNGYYAPLHWLKKIEPPAVTESIEREKEMVLR